LLDHPCADGDAENYAILGHISAYRRRAVQLTATLAGNNAAVLVAPPGAGKTTRVPLVLLDEPWAKGKKFWCWNRAGSPLVPQLRDSLDA
jgi:hypothetical protein